MSRHALQPRAELTDKVGEVYVGWDRPLSTFFVQVYDHFEQRTLWVGTRVGEVSTAGSAVAIAAGYAIIPDNFLTILATDVAGTADEPDSPLQAYLKSAGVVR